MNLDSQEIYEIEFYYKNNNESPLLQWLGSFDLGTQLRFQNKISRIKQGNFGDYKIISNNLYELRFFFGPGYRIYFSKFNKNKIVLLINGGNKNTQIKDMKIAKSYLEEYKQR